jgi:hypothetical protein
VGADLHRLQFEEAAQTLGSQPYRRRGKFPASRLNFLLARPVPPGTIYQTSDPHP